MFNKILLFVTLVLLVAFTVALPAEQVQGRIDTLPQEEQLQGAESAYWGGRGWNGRGLGSGWRGGYGGGAWQTGWGGGDYGGGYGGYGGGYGGYGGYGGGLRRGGWRNWGRR